MAGIFSKIRDALSVTETTIVQQKRVRPKSNCASCSHWCSPDALTQRVLPSARAIAWAKDNDFGRCTHPQRGGTDNSDKKRFTKADAGCDLWTPQPSGATGPAPLSRGAAAVAAAKKM